jgi:hypothetical protein
MAQAARVVNDRVTARRAAEYLVEYIRQYRAEYRRLTASPPNGPGFPPLITSPYVSGKEIHCYLATDGYLIADFSDKPDARTLSWLELTSQPPREIASGFLSKPSRPAMKRYADPSTRVVVTEHQVTLGEIVQRLTLGAMSPQYNEADPFWIPAGMASIGIRAYGGSRERQINYAEWSGHVEMAAWDTRSIWARVNVDVRKHLAIALGQLADRSHAVTQAGAPGATPDPEEKARARFKELGNAIDGLAKLLRDHPNDPEETFQRYLTEHPVLLTLYGTVIPKPRFRYPSGRTSPNGKTYVEPDFVISYPADGRYELVELERPNIELLTKAGEPRKDVTHAEFQIAEWVYYIHNHYHLIAERFPGISSEPLKRIVISRSTADQLSGRDLHEYLAFLRERNRDCRIVTYDILLQDARIAYAGVTGLLP